MITQTPVVDQTVVPLGANWRIAFYDADGIPLNMLSFEVINFGAISYTEVFQNVKTILATPRFSAPLERLLGVDQSIVDLPINKANEATVAILDAVTYWEPRCQVIQIDFATPEPDGHMIVNLQLQIQNIIFGTNIPYAARNIFSTPTQVVSLPPTLEPLPGVPGPPGAAGAQGTRGSVWFTGKSSPPSTLTPKIGRAHV